MDKTMVEFWFPKYEFRMCGGRRMVAKTSDSPSTRPTKKKLISFKDGR